MKRLFGLLSIASFFALSSCVYSLHPIYTKDSLVFEPELLGTWYLDDSSSITLSTPNWVGPLSVELGISDDDEVEVNGEVITDPVKRQQAIRDMEREFSRALVGKEDSDISPDKSYEIAFSNGEDTVKYLGHIAKIGSEHYLDLSFYEGNETDAIPFNVLMPVHSFVKIEWTQERLTMHQFDLSELRDLFRDNRVRLRHEMVDDEVLITAQPEEIQKFLKVYGKNPKVYSESDVYTRVRP